MKEQFLLLSARSSRAFCLANPHTLAPVAPAATSALGTLVIFVKEARGAPLCQQTSMYLRNTRKRGSKREGCTRFHLARGLAKPPLPRSSSGRSLQTEPPRPLAVPWSFYISIRWLVLLCAGQRKIPCRWLQIKRG